MKIEKRQKSPQGNVLKENEKKYKSPHKVMYGGPTKLVKVLLFMRAKTSLLELVKKKIVLMAQKVAFKNSLNSLFFTKRFCTQQKC